MKTDSDLMKVINGVELLSFLKSLNISPKNKIMVNGREASFISPDENTIIFLSTDKRDNIYEMGVDGSDIRYTKKDGIQVVNGGWYRSIRYNLPEERETLRSRGIIY
jgi:hypothetical protein